MNDDLKGELARLLSLRHTDPHTLLGAHPTPKGVLLRAFRPDAEAITLLVPGEPARPLTRVDERGLFEIVLTGQSGVTGYRFEIRYPGERIFTVHDAYATLPTLGPLDLHLLGEERHERIAERMGAHVRVMDGVSGVAFSVWAPNAEGVSVVGDFSGWDGRLYMMRRLCDSGIWEIFVPDVAEGAQYKFEIRGSGGAVFDKSDPYACAMVPPPGTNAVVHVPHHVFSDEPWVERRQAADWLRAPISIYELHVGSFRRVPEENARPLSYRELAPALADYVADLGFTHVELMPVMEHPLAASWGYQVSGYYAPTARFGSPDDLRFLVDVLHERGIGVILDWVPAHFPKDTFSLGRFDGTALYEHIDPRQGEHPDWGTYIFNFGRPEVRNFLQGNAEHWLESFHADGLRIDAVASMLYLDYSRKPGEWVPNAYGGRENLDAIAFMKELNRRAYEKHPGVLMIAEESTSWAGVSRPVYTGGLGFGFKWNMGWMHDTLAYFATDPVYRRYHHDKLTFGLLYAYSENFVLPLSHDEVVHGKGSLLSKMPGDDWQARANLRALYGHMWAHPGKKLLFMGGELGQRSEWNFDQSLDWHLLSDERHRGISTLVRDLNRIYRSEPALYEADAEPAGFRWIDASNHDDNVIAFQRLAPDKGRTLVCVCNFSPVVRGGYRIGVPTGGRYREILNTDASVYGGSNVGNMGAVVAEQPGWHGLPFALTLTLPPLGVVWLVPEGQA
jgi:1,4-alpha-glucan branching enzyme